MPKQATHSGSCLCGAVRFKAEGDPLEAGYCHCTMCQKASGAPVLAYATFRTKQVSFSAKEPTLYRSSSWARRGFCAACGSALTFQADKEPDTITFNVGCLDRPDRVEPTMHIYAGSRIPWFEIDDGLPRYEGEAPAEP